MNLNGFYNFKSSTFIFFSLTSLNLSSVQSLSRVQLFATLWTVARQAPPSMGFPRQEYWSGLPFPSPQDLPDPGIEPPSPVAPALQAVLPLSQVLCFSKFESSVLSLFTDLAYIILITSYCNP